MIYDQFADRWLISQFCTIADPTNHQLIAISKTGDPTGSYYLYDFVMPNTKFNDYPHFGMWPDAYYMTDNQFLHGTVTFAQAGVFAFNRAAMLVGDPNASYVYFDTATLFPPGAAGSANGTSGLAGMLPADLDGFTPPATGAPCPFACFQAGEFGDPGDRLRIFELHVDFRHPGDSTFEERAGSPLTVAAFDPRTVPEQGVSYNVVPEPPPATTDTYLDAIADRLMFRLAYRNFGGSESLVANHTVNAANNPAYRAGVRYYQLTRGSPTAAFTIAHQETFAGAANDTSHRWMGSGAMNFKGDLALGYSVSSTSVFPSIRYAARLGTDPANAGLVQGETTLIAGGGSQRADSARWGDYSDMTVDPADDCSFWYTQEYYPVSSEPGNATVPWHTRVLKFAPGPVSVSPRGAISGTITNCQTGLPVPNAIVRITSGFSRATENDGAYTATVPPGSYDATASGTGYNSVSIDNLVVSDGGTATFNACLVGNLKKPAADTAAIVADACNSNGAIDPQETVTVSFAIKNAGTVNIDKLVATLQPSGNVINASAQEYGLLVAGGAAVSRSFTFRAANVACGAPLVATLQVRDGAIVLGNISYNFNIGSQNVPVQETFDGVTVPALPAGWTAANATGPAPTWVTKATIADTPPNVAYIDDPGVVSDKHLDTPEVAVATSDAQLSFRHLYSLESAHDGGVLEVSSPNINGGAFTDVTNAAAGGSFVTGGYNTAIASGSNSPIATRQAWTGASKGYVSTLVNLGSKVAGQTIKLRFRMASDTGFGGAGWRIDSVKLSEGFQCSSCPTISPSTVSKPPKATQVFTASGGSGTGYVFGLLVNNSLGSIDSANGAYTAGPVGNVVDTVQVTDSSGNDAVASVHVTVALAVNPGVVDGPPKGAQTFAASGGSESGYVFSLAVNNSGGSITPAGAYQAGATGNVTDVIQVADDVGGAATANFNVGPGVALVPSNVSLAPGQTQGFAATGGSGSGYVFSLETNNSGGTIDASTGAYTAGAAGNATDVVKVQDSLGNVAVANVTVVKTSSTLANISTRLRVETGDNVLIGGFIVSGSQPKKLILRAIGPSLPVAEALADPLLELHDVSGTLVETNDNWVDAANKQEIIDSTVAPTNDLESAILTSLSPNPYTAIVRGVSDATGIGLVEVYDLDRSAESKLANISTRGLVQSGDNVLIGGLIVLGEDPLKVIVRAIGPSLPVDGALADPLLELHGPNGDVIAANDQWRSDQEAEIIASTVPPESDAEAAIVQTLSPGSYTAIVRGANDSTGVALVDVYELH